MSNPSNLYAEKIFSEHPLVLWALDDQVDYISLISEAQRDMTSGWTIQNGTALSGSSITGTPFQDSTTTIIEGDLASGDTIEITSISPNLVSSTDLISQLGTFSVGTYFYSNTIYLQTVSIGYEYTDPDTSLVVQNLKTFTTALYQKWAFISETFEIPDVNADIRIVLKTKLITGAALTNENQFYFNGITLGQWSEEFITKSLGLSTSIIPSTISTYGGLQGIEAQAYGIAEYSGYYIAEGELRAKNTSIPLVYGASGVTKLNPYTDASLILPGRGFLNKKGQYNDYTIEFWARINSDTKTAKRIFGPIGSTDGLYVESGFLTFVIGDQFASHFVGEWFRPMLIDIRLIRNSVSVLINGEQVLSLIIDTATLDLPDELDEFGKNQDWLGFYSYSDVSPFEIDCVAIYSYQVPINVAKRRWVYGQGVLSPEGLNAAYGGVTAFVDYPFANHTANYNYPDFAQWQQGTFDNLVTTQTSLRTPEYSLPEIFLGTKTLSEFYLDNQSIQDETNKFITFRPNGSWDTVPAYINFPRFNILNDQIHVIYSVIQINDADESEQTIIKIYNTLTGNDFSIRKDGTEIHYYLTYNGIEEEIYTSPSYSVGVPIAVGIDIQGVIESFGGNVASFFGNQNGLKMYVGGDDTGTTTFTGYIYSVGISSSYNETKIESHFYGGGIYGIADIDAGQELLDHTASYTLLPSEVYGKFFLDIGVAGYWQDYMPLSYFAKYVKNDVGNQFYDLDFIQFNLGYPSPSQLTQVPESNPATYYYDTTGADVKSYVTFQYIANGANQPGNFLYEEVPNEEKIIDIDNYPDWLDTRFEILNNTLIYPTKTIDFNALAIVYSLEFNSRGILTKPISLNRLQLASKSLNDNSFNPIGTRFGVDLFPYKKSGIYYDYKSKNPFSIYKESTPYLYLTKTSGIEVRGDLNPLENRGISFPINRTTASSYRISAMQIWTRYDKDQFPDTPKELFEIEYKEDTIKFYVVANSPSGDRGKIFALTKGGIEYNGLSFYLNGTLVREPVLTVKEWSVIGLSFSTSLIFDSYLGRINLNGPAIFNNIAYYQSNSLQEIQSSAKRPWFKVLTDGVTVFDWQYWLNNFTWDGVLVISQSEFYGINPSSIYSAYIGTNKIIIDDNEGLTVVPEKMKIYSDTDWSISVAIPV